MVKKKSVEVVNNVVFDRGEMKDILRENKNKYGKSINVYRASISVFDGLKLVHRRIIHEMNNKGLGPKSSPTKLSDIGGSVIAKWHPHGNASVEDAAVTLSQDFSVNHTLINIKGNNGFVDGSSAAASRYISGRLTQMGNDLLDNIKDNAVDWEDNYLETDKEPSVLPAKYPLALINGGFGIGQGYSCSIPSHNFNEVADLVIDFIQGKVSTLDEVAERLLPDFPTGGILINKDEIKNYYKTGRGLCRLRGKIVKDEKTHSLIIKEIPYMTNTGSILDEIQSAVIAKNIEDLTSVKDKTNKKKGIEIVLKVKKNASLDVVEAQLYKFTSLQTTFNISLFCNDGYDARMYNVLEMIQKWVDFRRTTKRRILNFEMGKKRRRMHILEALIEAFNDLDNIIAIIRKSKGKADAKALIEKKYGFSDIQSEGIVNLPLYRLNSLSLDELKDEFNELNDQVADLVKYFTDPRKLDKEIIKELKEGKKKHGRERRTELIQLDTSKDVNKEDLIKNDEYFMYITHGGYIKKIPVTTKTRGNVYGKLKDGDYVTSAIRLFNKDNLLMFTNKGRVFCIKPYNVEDCTTQTLGDPINNHVKFIEGEKIVSCIGLTNDQFEDEELNLVFFTTKGLVKKTSIKHYKNIQKGIIAIKVNAEDEVLTVHTSHSDEDEVLLVTHNGVGNKYKLSEVTPYLRVSAGMKAMNLNPDDRIVSANIVKDTDKYIFIVCNNGVGKKIDISQLPNTKRDTKGRLVIKLMGNNVEYSKLISDDQIVTIITDETSHKIESNKIPTLTRITQGKKLISVKKNETITDMLVD